MFSKSKLKDYIGILYYRHGLFCASNPILCLMMVFSVVFVCCYPLKNLQSLNGSLEQYKQPIEAFDGLEAKSEINEFIQYEKLADRPAWYNRIPIAYIQRIVVKSVLNIPKSHLHSHENAADPNLFSSGGQHNKSDHSDNIHMGNNSKKLVYLIDAFRTPLAQLFELNEYIRNFQSSNGKKSLVGDLCVHVGELIKKDVSSSSSTSNRAHLLPEFNCLYLSPANYWQNDFSLFLKDDDIMQTMNDQMPSVDEDQTGDERSAKIDGHADGQLGSSSSLASAWSKIVQHFYSSTTNAMFDKTLSANLRELLFGVSWQSTLRSLDDDFKLNKKLANATNNRYETKSIVLTYAITIALKNYDKEFLDELKEKLEAKFSLNLTVESTADNDDQTLSTADDDQKYIYNLQYIIQGLVYYIPVILLYVLLFLYIYISVRKIEFVKSKWGLALAAVSQVIASLFMSIGICSYFGLTPTLNGSEIFPYLIIFIGFENIVVLTKSVVSTPFDLEVRYRIALGLKKESWVITKILTFELIIIVIGIFTMVPAIQEFCVFAYVGLLIDFFMQMIFFVTVLSIDIRRMELSDLNRKLLNPNNTNKRANIKSSLANTDINDSRANSAAIPDNNQIIYRGMSKTNGSGAGNETNKKRNQKFMFKPTGTFKDYLLTNNYCNFFTNKSMQFFYFWARTRLVQRVIMILSALWIILIFYKSLLIVELMRHDVNVKKETVEALLPKGVGLPKLIKDNFQQFLFTSTLTASAAVSSSSSVKLDSSRSHLDLSTIDYFKRHFKNFMSSLQSQPSAESTTNTDDFHADGRLLLADGEPNWRSLSYNHWLTLFAFYNVSLYNRYVAILPQINLCTLVKHADIIKYRNDDELKKYSHSVLSAERPSSDTGFNQLIMDELNQNRNETLPETESNYRSALVELFGIVVFGLPAIVATVYLLILLYKCLCSRNYEHWRRSWSTSNIKRQYKMIHHKKKRHRRRRRNSDSSSMGSSTSATDSSEYSDCLSEEDEHSSDADARHRRAKKKHSDYETDKSDDGDETTKSGGEFVTKNNCRNDEDDLNYLERVINGKRNNVELQPLKVLNSSYREGRHEYPVDLITYGAHFVCTSDLSNRVHVWSLDSTGVDSAGNIRANDLIKTINLNQTTDESHSWQHKSGENSTNTTSTTTSIWALRLDDTDRYLFIGLSNGILKAIDLSNNKIFNYAKNAPYGITHLTTVKSTLKIHTPDECYLLVARLNGFLELIQLGLISSNSNPAELNIRQMDITPVYNSSPITRLTYSGDYILTYGAEACIKVIKLTIVEQQHQPMVKCLNLMFELNEHGHSPVTALCLDRENSIHAASGSQNGLICLWNLFTGECKFKLNSGKKTRAAAVKLELVDSYLISLDIDQQMCLWNRHNGQLMRDFRLVFPIYHAPNAANNNDQTIAHDLDIDTGSSSRSFFNQINVNLLNLIRRVGTRTSTSSRTHPLSADDTAPPPSMCPYSKNVLITSGCACLYLWDIAKAELIKKITIRLKNNAPNGLSPMCQIKQIRVVRQLDTSVKYSSGRPRVNKLVLLTDCTDSIYVLKIPSYIIQND